MSTQVLKVQMELAASQPLEGYRAGCTGCDGPMTYGVSYLVGWSGWYGPFRENWIEAALDAKGHEIKRHPEGSGTWDEIVGDNR